MHPNMSERVRLLQMTLHWHMTGERHFKFLTGRDISPEPHTRQAGRQTDSTDHKLVGPPPLTHSQPRYTHRERGREGGSVGRVGGAG